VQLRHGELLRSQERLVCDMERAVEKRDVITTRVMTLRHCQTPPAAPPHERDLCVRASRLDGQVPHACAIE
jgi:hypothetical protein